MLMWGLLVKDHTTSGNIVAHLCLAAFHKHFKGATFLDVKLLYPSGVDYSKFDLMAEINSQGGGRGEVRLPIVRPLEQGGDHAVR